MHYKSVWVENKLAVLVMNMLNLVINTNVKYSFLESNCIHTYPAL